jgi:glycerate 2-kinase
MKVMVAIDSYKGSISSSEASNAISLGIQDVYPNCEITALPLADGGEGTVETLVNATKGQFILNTITGPMREKVDAIYGILENGRTAVIEVVAACGLTLVPIEKRNPLITTTFGVGELICDAMEKGCREFIIGLGGSSTNDAGVGMLQALGYRFLNENNEEVEYGGIELQHIRKIDRSKVHPLVEDCTFKVACDVNNPLFGLDGAAFVFGPQKGASREMILELDQGLKSFRNVVFQELGKDINQIPGAGAAGGLGAAFAGFLHADLQSGIQLVMEIIHLEEKIKNIDIIITGEGKLDGQTSMGKAPFGISQLAQKYNIPVIALAGGIPRKASPLNASGMTSIFSILNEPMSLEDAMDYRTTFDNLYLVTNQIFRLIKVFQHR